mgnify:FL=1
MISKNEIKLQSEIKYFIRRYLKNFEYIYLTSDLRGFIFHYKIGPKEICKILFSELLKTKKNYNYPRVQLC